MHFTGFLHDYSMNLEHAWYRQYGSTQGRWTTPDPSGLAAVNPANPQTWNRYAYVMNSPLSLVDPLGLDCGAGTVNNFGDNGLLPGSITTDASGRCPTAPIDWEWVCSSGTVLWDGAEAGSYFCRPVGFGLLPSHGAGRGRPAVKPAINLLQKVLHKTACISASPLLAAAKLTNGVVGTGFGGSFGFGIWVTGVSGSASGSLVADPQGNVGFALSAAGNPGAPGVVGAGWSGGRTLTFADSQTFPI